MNALVIFTEIITANLSSSSAVLAASTINIQTITATLLSQLSTIIVVSDLPAGSTITLANSSTLIVITISINCSAGALTGVNLFTTASTTTPTTTTTIPTITLTTPTITPTISSSSSNRKKSLHILEKECFQN